MKKQKEIYKTTIEYLQNRVNSILDDSSIGGKVRYNKEIDSFIIDFRITFMKREMITKTQLYGSRDIENCIDHILLKAVGSIYNKIRAFLLSKE